MRVGILRFSQTTNDRPWLFTSCKKAKQLVLCGTHIKISKKIIKEIVEDSTRSSPERHYIPKVSTINLPIPQLNPPGIPTTLNLFYPVHDMSSYSARNMREIWGCDLVTWQRRFAAYGSCTTA